MEDLIPETPLGGVFEAHISRALMFVVGCIVMWVLGRFGTSMDRARKFHQKAAIPLEARDIVGYGPTVCLGAFLLGRGSWPPGRLASHAILALSNPRGQVYLALLWCMMLLGLVKGVGGMRNNTVAFCCVGAVITCAGPLQGLLLAFTPVARRRDLASALAVAIAQGVCTVKIGMESDASMALLADLVIWFVFLVSLATLKTDNLVAHQRARNYSRTDCVAKIEEFCELTERSAAQIDRARGSVEDLLVKYRDYGGHAEVVRRVLYNQLPNAASRRLGVVSDDGNTTSTPLYAKAEFEFAGASIGRLKDVTIAPRDQWGTGNLADRHQLERRRFFVCSSVQRPTIEPDWSRHLIPIIVGEADLEDATPEGDKRIDVGQIMVMQEYRQTRLRRVTRDNAESSGPIRGKWSITVELYLLVTISTLLVGWGMFGIEPLAPLTFWIGSTFSAFMLCGPPPDYVALWRLLERLTRRPCLISNNLNCVARTAWPYATLQWFFCACGFGAMAAWPPELDSQTWMGKVLASRWLPWGWLSFYWALKVLDMVLSFSATSRYRGLATIYNVKTTYGDLEIEGCDGAKCVAPGHGMVQGNIPLMIRKQIDGERAEEIA